MHVVLSLESKLAILDRLQAGATQEYLADTYRIRRSIVGILKERGEDSIVRIENGKHGDQQKGAKCNALGR